MGFLTSFVKNGEIIPSLSYKIILEKRDEKINSFCERNNSCSALVHFGNNTART